VASYKLTQLARSQLLAIHRYTEEKFGRAQADKYLAGFHRIFSLVAKVPKMGRRASDIKPGYRRHLYHVHRIFYTVEDDCVVIRAIYHTSLDLPEASD
jgi:toxin ParE1/3/4